ncbi:hypothetical protein GGI23_007454 [Coemansia sp. RSA 2559]|nr:hypothetical protein GGI23_007454 [Coemansia sp. RSA 2559]
MKQWYDGYQFGRFRGKYNPWAVCYYLNELTGCVHPRSLPSDEDILALIKSCARNYWDKTGSTGVIEKQMEMAPSEFCEVANKLLQEYKEHMNPDIVTPQSPKTAVYMPSDEFTLSSLAPEKFKQRAFLNLMLCAGYLTARSPTTVGIPNGEVQRVWESILRRVLLRNMSTGQDGTWKGKLLNEFYRGKTDFFQMLMESAVVQLARHTNTYREMEYTNVAVGAIASATKLGILTPTHKRDINGLDYTMIREAAAGKGRADWVMLLYSTKNVRGAFGAIVELKFIPNAKVSDEKVGKAKAKEGIDQIEERLYGTLVNDCVECIHIGVAVGVATVHMASKLFKRDNAGSKWIPTDSLI